MCFILKPSFEATVHGIFEGIPHYKPLDMMGQLKVDTKQLEDINPDLVRKDEGKVVVSRGSPCG
jgi:hypothetical protein